jgi:hypothetical protein
MTAWFLLLSHSHSYSDRISDRHAQPSLTSSPCIMVATGNRKLLMVPCSLWFLVLIRLGSVAPFQVGRPGGATSSLSIFRRSPRRATTTELNEATATLAALDALFQASPYTAAAITCGVKASGADLVAQKRQYRKRDQTTIDDGEPKKTDVKRNFAFMLYGAIYQGMTQEFIYNHLYPVYFGTGTSVGVVLTKVCFDLLIQTTLLTLPIAYLTKALLYNYSAKEALRRYRDDIMNHGLLKKYFLLWGPVQCFTFSIVPEHYRVTFVACVSFFWIIILSSITSKLPTADECELADGLTCNEK